MENGLFVRADARCVCGCGGDFDCVLFADGVFGQYGRLVLLYADCGVPLYFLQEENNFRKCFKKSFIIFFDNAAFSFVMLVYNLLLLALSFVLFFLLPGINGITLSNTNALRLRLYKYDWLEEHPDYVNNRDKRADVPWDELLADDSARENLLRSSFRGNKALHKVLF